MASSLAGLPFAEGFRRRAHGGSGAIVTAVTWLILAAVVMLWVVTLVIGRR